MGTSARRFEVWIDKGVPGQPAIVSEVEMPIGATDDECEEACSERLQDMLGNELDTGWREMK